MMLTKKVVLIFVNYVIKLPLKYQARVMRKGDLDASLTFLVIVVRGRQRLRLILVQTNFIISRILLTKWIYKINKP